VDALHRGREKAWPTLSTVGTRKAERQPYRGRCRAPSDLLDAERRVLECLGAALVSEWNDLPTDVQRRLFEHAASGKSHDAALLKAQIARFLHNHKDDWAAR
jgi:hypothetical protein